MNLKKNLDYNELNKKHSYSFVLQHVDNRIVSQIPENNIILVEEYDFDSDNVNNVNLNLTNYESITTIKNV